MRIAFFTDTYLPSRDGVVTSILLAKTELEKLGHQVFVFAPEPDAGAHREADVHYFRSVRFRRYQGYRVPIFPTNKCEILDELKVDVIHNHGLAFMALRSMFAGRTLKRPVVTTWHTNLTEAVRYYNFTGVPDDVAVRLIWIYMRSLLRRSEVVIAPTEAIRSELRSYAPDIRRLEVVPTGVDLERFSQQVDGTAVRSRYDLAGRKMILHLGRIASEKNLDLVLEGFANLSRRQAEVVLFVAGEGPAKERYVQRAKELGIADRTIFTGFVKDEELPAYYAACDLFTIASKFETQGLVVLEAMATGKPVVGIDFRAVAELIEDNKNGYLFQESPESWTAAVEKALRAPPELKMEARRRAEHFSQTEGARRLVEIYQAAMVSKRSRVEGKWHLK